MSTPTTPTTRRAARSTRFGILLPHFGSAATRDNLVAGSALAEGYGFDSIWVRDHVVYRPHPYEDPDPTHLDPLVVLAAAAAVTTEITLATAVLIPHRHPIAAASALASLDLLSGGGRLLVGFGTGIYDHEFEAVGLGDANRFRLMREHVEIFRALWTGQSVTHDGEYYQFHDIDIHPSPGPRSIPVWSGGTGSLSVRRAVAYCDGWLASRIPRRDFSVRLAEMRDLADQAGKPCPTPGIVVTVSPAPTVEEGEAQLQIGELAKAMARNKFSLPASGRFQTMEDFDGVFMAGPPAVLIEETEKWVAAGAEHVVFDFRPAFARYREVLSMLATEVLPALVGADRPADGRPTGSRVG